MKLNIWDTLSIIVLAIAGLVLLGVIFIFLDPGTSVNPYPPAWTATPTATLNALPPTWTPSPTPEVTKRPTSTPYPSPTPFSLH